MASPPQGRVDGDERAEVAIPIGAQAPGVARSAIAQWLADHVSPSCENQISPFRLGPSSHQPTATNPCAPAVIAVTCAFLALANRLLPIAALPGPLAVGGS